MLPGPPRSASLYSGPCVATVNRVRKEQCATSRVRAWVAKPGIPVVDLRDDN